MYEQCFFFSTYTSSKMNYITYTIIFLTIIFIPLHAQNEFSYQIPNARAIGYGGSAVTMTDNPAIIFWNPGGLAFTVNDQVMLNMSAPSLFNYIALTKFLPPRDSFGFSLSRLKCPADFLDVATIGYGRRINPFIAIGANFNYGKLNNVSDDFATTSVGILFRPAVTRSSFYQSGNSLLDLFVDPALYNRFALGIMIHNIPIHNSKVDHEVRIGTNFKFSDWGPVLNLGQHFRRGKNSTHIGAGLNLSQNFYFFMGFSSFDINRLAMGGSIRYQKVYCDIGYSPDFEKIFLSFSLQLQPDPNTLARNHIEQGTKMIRENEFRNGLAEFEKSLSYYQNNERIIYLTNVLKRRVEAEDAKIDSLFRQAEAFKSRGWGINAIITYKNILELNPKNERAIDDLNKLRPHLNRYIKLLYKTGEKLYHEDDLDRSKTVFKEILQLNKGHNGALKYLAKIDSVTSYLSSEYYYRGLGFYNQRHLNRSRDAFNRVLELNPNHSEARHYLKKIDQELESNEEFVQSLMREAYRLERSGKYLEASRKYDKILEINRDNEKARKQLEILQAYIKTIVNRKFKRARSLFNKGKYEEARLAFEDILSIRPMHQESKNYLKRIREIESDKIEEYFQLAKKYFEENRWNAALKECENVLALYPDHAEAKKMQSDIWTRTSIEELQDKGMQLFNNGEYHRALNIFEQILEKDSGHIIAKSYVDECRTKLNKKIAELFNSGMRFYTSGNYEAAIREWNRILALDPSNESALEYKKRANERLEALKQLP